MNIEAKEIGQGFKPEHFKGFTCSGCDTPYTENSDRTWMLFHLRGKSHKREWYRAVCGKCFDKTVDGGRPTWFF
jgi:hypothetical protein